MSNPLADFGLTTIFSSLLRRQLYYFPAIGNLHLFCILANHFLRGQHCSSLLTALEGKTIALRTTDIQRCFHIIIRCKRLHAAPGKHYDIRISGQLQDFLQLALRQQDPDTLFFQRRLQLEGEVETGLLVKNFLDQLEYDWSAHFSALREWLP